jgi:phosphoribosylglycinamide formyltransferase-1
MEVPVLPGDDEATLHERIKKVERGLIVATIPQVLAGLK